MTETNKKAIRWYYKPVWVVVAILVAGPFALPLVWISPELKKWLKVLLTIATVLITVWLVKATFDIYKIILKEMTELQATLQ